MKSRISLLVTCLAVVGITTPINAEITKTASPTPASTRVKNLETILRNSGLCKHYPNVVKVLKDNTAEIATYADRRLSDKEIKMLALNLAKLIATNVNNIVAVKVRLYDPASTKYWKDIVLSAAQIQEYSKSASEPDQILSSIKVVNNFGLVDGPNLEARIETYKHILKLQHAGVPVQPYISQFMQIEKAEKEKQNIDAQMSALNTTLANVDSTITKPISSIPENNDITKSLEQAWQDACQRESAAQQVVEEAEQEQQALALPGASDMDAQARYAEQSQASQRTVEAALEALYKVRQERDVAYEELQQSKEHQ